MKRLLSILWMPLASNVLLLGAILHYGWDVRQLLLLLWAENFIVGFWNLARIAVARPPRWGNVGPGELWLGRGLYALGFSLFYFGLNIGMGMMLGGILEGHLQGGMLEYGRMLEKLATDKAALAILAVLAISHGIAYFAYYVGRREYLSVTPQELRNRPFPRMLVTTVMCLWGAPALLILDLPMAGVAAFVGVKFAVDLWLCWGEYGSSQ